MNDSEYRKNSPTRIISTILATIVWIVAFILIAATSLILGGDLPEYIPYYHFLGVILWGTFIGFSILSWVKERWLCDLLDMSVFAFLLYAAFSYWIGPAKYTSQIEILWISTYAALFLNLRHAFRHRSWAISFIIAILVVAFVVVAYGFIHYHEDVYSIWGIHDRPDYGVRMSGTFGCPNQFANFMVVASVAALSLFFIPSFPEWCRYLFMFSVVVFSSGIFFAISRAGYISWIIGVGVLMFVAFRRIRWPSWVKWVIAAAIPILLYVSITGSYAVLERLNQRHLEDIRTILARDTIQIWQKSPLIGTGPTTFEFYHPRVHDEQYNTHARFAHNEYLNLLSDYGAIGAILVCVFFILIVRDLIKNRRVEYPSPSHAWLNAMGYGILVASGIHAVADFNFHIPACALLFFALLAFATMKTIRDPYPGAHRSWTFLAGVLSVVVLIPTFLLSYAGYAATRHYKENEWRIAAISFEEGMKLAEESHEYNSDYPVLAESVADSFRLQLYDRFLKNPAPDDKEFLGREKLFNAAMFLYERAHRINPLDDALIIKEASLYDYMGRFAEAYMLYQQALKLQPNNRFYYRALGVHFWCKGEMENARDAFRKELSFNVDTSDLKYMEQSQRLLKLIEEAIQKQEKDE